ncbi:MAG: hypothetical protein EA396_04205 [Anaerolineaceae bacterium]|nr:MAG: hypothetical protein EA396_04205 [Anaerolineaceae bacterium]
MTGRQKPQDDFRHILLTVVGGAYTAAGYHLDERPVQWAGGRFRFVKALDDGEYGIIEYQLLAYVDTEWSARQPSRFKVTLRRSATPESRGGYQRDLSALVVEDFGVAILPSADHWWTYQNTETLGKALLEAGHLVIGYGIPFLAGDLKPDTSNDG